MKLMQSYCSFVLFFKSRFYFLSVLFCIFSFFIPFWFFKCSFYSVFESQSKKVISLASILIHRMLISPRLLFGIMKLIFLERHNKKQPYDIYNCICSGDIIEATVCHIFKCSLHAVLWVISFKTEFYKVLLGLRYCKLSSFRQ